MHCSDYTFDIRDSLDILVRTTNKLRNFNGKYEDLDLDEHFKVLAIELGHICYTWHTCASMVVKKCFHGEPTVGFIA
jgi:hypothetical protein